MKVFNESNIISLIEIKKCINLLPKKYIDLDVEIVIYNSKLQLLKDNYKNSLKSIRKSYKRFNIEQPKRIYVEAFISFLANIKDMKLELSNKIGGDFSYTNNKIRIFSYAYNNHKTPKQGIIFALFHELRHKYQHEYINERFKKDEENYIQIGNGYKEQWIEKDANNFAQRMFLTHLKTISKILGEEI